MGIQNHGHLPKLNERHSRKHAPPFMSSGLQQEERQDTCAPCGIIKYTTHLCSLFEEHMQQYMQTNTRRSFVGHAVLHKHSLQDEVRSIPSLQGIFTSTKGTVPGSHTALIHQILESSATLPRFILKFTGLPSTP